MTAGLAPAPPRPTPTHRRQGRRHRRPGLLPIAVIVVCFVASRIGFWLAGVRFDMTPLTVGSEQLLAVRLLRGGQLLTSVWHLQSQPPLFNM